jgi:hypothetical protein
VVGQGPWTPLGAWLWVLGYTRTRGPCQCFRWFLTNKISSVRLLFRVLKEEEHAKVEIPSVA